MSPALSVWIMSNRVAELESRVAELQATVDGLTEELVETRERLRQLETAVEDDEQTRGGRRPVGGETGVADGSETATDGDERPAGADKGDTEAEAEADAGSGSDSDDGGDIIVA
jgi:hypothetical protein